MVAVGRESSMNASSARSRSFKRSIEQSPGGLSSAVPASREVRNWPGIGRTGGAVSKPRRIEPRLRAVLSAELGRAQGGHRADVVIEKKLVRVRAQAHFIELA